MITAIEVDAGCRNQMLWRCDLVEALPTAALVSALGDPALGNDVFHDTSQSVPGLLVIVQQRATGHQIVFVPRTGRLQIRLDGLTPVEERESAAAELYEVLRRACVKAAASAT